MAFYSFTHLLTTSAFATEWRLRRKILSCSQIAFIHVLFISGSSETIFDDWDWQPPAG